MNMRKWIWRLFVATDLGAVGSTSTFAQCPAEWFPVGDGLAGGSTPKVLSLTVFNADLIAGGNFTLAGGQPANYIARWDGQQWHALGAGLNGEVDALAVYNGELIAGGGFTQAGGQPASHIARWDGSQWQPLGAGMDGAVWSFAVYNGDLIAGGPFNYAGGQLVWTIARWDGAQWYPLDTGLQAYGDPMIQATVTAMINCFDLLLVGGGFNHAGPNFEVWWFVQWDGARWESDMPSLDYAANAFAIRNDVELYAGGDFGEGQVLKNVYFSQWWDPLDPLDNRVNALTVLHGDLYAGGRFLYSNTLPLNRIARSTDGWSWLALGSGTNGEVRALGTWNGDLIAGGAFTQAGNQPVSRIARWGCRFPLGDLNCDSAVNFDDINPFVLALSDPAGYTRQYPNCYLDRGDCNGDGLVDFGDINPFVALLTRT